MRAGRNLDKIRSGLKVTSGAEEMVSTRGQTEPHRNLRCRKYCVSSHGCFHSLSRPSSTTRRGLHRPAVPATCPNTEGALKGSKKALPVTAEFEANAEELLERLMNIAKICSSVECEASQRVGGMTVERITHESECSVWIARMPGCSVPCLCSRAELCSDVSVEAALLAIYSMEERLQWDRASFVQYDVLCQGALQPATGAWADAVYCRMRAPTGISDRDVVQERFLMKTSGGGYAIVMRSPSDSRAAGLVRPAVKGLTRATTLLSGYVLEPREGGGVLLTAMSQTDLGGSIPGWAQNLAKKASKRKLLEWAQLLEAHCSRRPCDEAQRARRAKLFSFVEASVAATGGCVHCSGNAGDGGSRKVVLCEGTNVTEVSGQVQAEKSMGKPGIKLLSAVVGLAVAAIFIAALPGLRMAEAESWG